MKTGLVAFMPQPEAIKLARELGIFALPVNMNPIVEKSPKEAIKPIVDAGMAICQVAAFAYNPLSPETEKQAEEQVKLEKAIPLMADTGCRYIVINGGNYDSSGFMRGHAENFSVHALDEVARRLAPVVTLAEKHGVYIVIEPFIQCVINTPRRFLDLKEKVGSSALSITLDICNFISYEDLWCPLETVSRICWELRGHYHIAHCKDITVTAGTHMHIDEVPLGQGMIDWKTAMKHIANDLPDDGYFIYEHVKSAEDGRAGMSHLRSIASDIGITLS